MQKNLLELNSYMIKAPSINILILTHLNRIQLLNEKHQHFLNVARSLMFHAKVPIEFWGDCIGTSTFNINRTPCVLLKGKSPYELLYDKLHVYSKFRVFGCRCCISSIPQHRNIFTPRAVVFSWATLLIIKVLKSMI